MDSENQQIRHELEHYDISSESSHASCDGDEHKEMDEKIPAKDREERQRSKYLLTFQGSVYHSTAWERMEDGEIACHASKLMFATAVQCVNHRRKQQYKADLAASSLPEDNDFLAWIEQKAQEEKERLHQQKYEVIKQRNLAKQDLRIEAARLAKANRQLEHELLISKSKIEKIQAQHERQLEHVKSTYQRKVDKLLRQLEQKSKGANQGGPEVPPKGDNTDATWALPSSPVAPTKPSGLVPEIAQDPWAPVEFDTVAGLQLPGQRPFPVTSFDPLTKMSVPAIPEEVMKAFMSPQPKKQVPTNRTFSSSGMVGGW